MSNSYRLTALTQRSTLAAATLLLPSMALAGGEAVMVASAQPMHAEGLAMDAEQTTMTMTWQDANNMRINFDDDSSTYLIMRDGKAYSISQEDGKALVMDMASMSGMIQAMGKAMNKGKGSGDPFGSIDSVSATQQNKTVAGINGTVYNMTWTEPDGSQQSGKAVLTGDPLTVEMTQAYINYMGAMLGSDHVRAYQEAMPKNASGLLQMADQLYVESIRAADPPASLFELPAEPMDLQGLMGDIMGGDY
ncbi:hypothetical protein [Oceanisphaera pacifica]|uniref:DUF4412 domain-containing protein n=1 Tax=Oceanisphaera pacifica TaxID=2818389 RepID=A0ABS3NEA2_9GAMM|nr:hypothetical protein [Oceanisphaera pacifica]MBO1518718.1 hypothetical protein [Oceanisphaera pacifica]